MLSWLLSAGPCWGRSERGRNVVRGHERADDPGRHGHGVADRRQGSVRAARPCACGADTGPLCPRARVLPRRADADAIQRFRHQGRGLAAGLGMERQVSGGGQRRLRRRRALPGHGSRGAGRLRDGGHRYRPRRQHRRVRPRPSREGGGLRLSRHPRDDGGRQARHRRALRPGPAVLVLQRLLTGRPPGDHQRAALSGRLRRHRRRRGGMGSDAQPRRAAGAEPDDEPLAGGGDSAQPNTR